MNIIEVKNLKKYFKVFKGLKKEIIKAVDEISFEVKKGEVFGFLGPNGAGKTTTIRCLMNFIWPTEGEIFILRQNVLKNPSLRKKIGYLSGDVRLYENWTGEDHIKFIEKIKGKSKIIEKLIRDFDFNPDIKTKNLSTGNRQKLGLILALMNDPEVLIMDEPTVGLDPLLQNVFYRIVRDLKTKGKTIFVSSHNLKEVEKICDKVALIKEGKIKEVQKVENLTKKRWKRVEVTLEGSYKKADFRIKGVEKIEENHQGFVFKVRGDITPLIKKLSSFKIKDITIFYPSLEEIFLDFYKKE